MNRVNGVKETQYPFRFLPFSHSWVAVHPRPRGIIQFVGSFFIFGTLPTVFYYNLLENLYHCGYTIVVYPSSLIPPLDLHLKQVNHYRAAIQLLKEEYAVRLALISYILNCPELDSLDVYLQQSNYFWLGHSLGCKYIMLLEILSDSSRNISEAIGKCSCKNKKLEMIESEISSIETERTSNESAINQVLSQKGIKNEFYGSKFIIDQPSIFLALEIYGTVEKKGKPQSAISFFDLFPSGTETLCLIEQCKSFFNLIAIASFTGDQVSVDDIKAFRRKLDKRSQHLICKSFQGYKFKPNMLSSLLSHLKPSSQDNLSLATCLEKIFNELQQRSIPNYVFQQVQCEDCEDCLPKRISITSYASI